MFIDLMTIAMATAIWLLYIFPSAHVIMVVRKITGPKGLSFFIGETWNFMEVGCDDILYYLEGLNKSYQRLSAFYLSGLPMVLIHKPQDVKNLLESNKLIQKGAEYDAIMSWLNEGLITIHGTKWNSRRKLLTPIFHFEILEDALSGMAQYTDILANNFSKTDGQSIIIDDYITRCTLDIIAETAMGVKLEDQLDVKNQYLECVKRISGLITLKILSVYQTNDLACNHSCNRRYFHETLKTLQQFTDKVIAERKELSVSDKLNEDGLGCKTKKAFLDSLIVMQKADPKSFTDKDIREEVDTFLFEGHNTISAALCFALWLLGSYPEEQEKLYQEILETVGDGEINMANLNTMSYLERIIKETLRLYPSVPYISRSLTEDLVLDDGTLLLNSTNVVVLPFFLHRDPQYFPDPEKFDPDRFTEEAAAGRHPYSYIPFSAGPRNCIGEKFAMLEMKMTLASVIRKCRVEAITKKEEFKIQPSLIIRPTAPIKCKFITRSK